MASRLAFLLEQEPPTCSGANEQARMTTRHWLELQLRSVRTEGRGGTEERAVWVSSRQRKRLIITLLALRRR